MAQLPKQTEAPPAMLAFQQVVIDGIDALAIECHGQPVGAIANMVLSVLAGQAGLVIAAMFPHRIDELSAMVGEVARVQAYKDVHRMADPAQAMGRG